MKSEQKQGYICYINLTQNRFVDVVDTLEILDKYWELDNDANNGFAHSVTKLNQMYKGRFSNISTFAQSYSYFSIDSAPFNCQHCNCRQIFRNRQAVISTHYKGFICRTCKDKERYLAEQKPNKPFINVEKYKNKVLESGYKLSTLTYLEKVFLFLLLSEYHRIERQPLNIISDNVSITGCKVLDVDFMNKLEQKGSLLVINEIPESIREENAKLIEHSLMLDLNQSNREQYTKGNDSGALMTGTYLCYNSEFTSFVDLLAQLYSDIEKRKLTRTDVEDIHILVERMRLNSLYQIVSWSCDKFNIQAESSLRLENTLSYLAKSNSLMTCCWFIHNRAEKVAASLNGKTLPIYIINKLLTKDLDSYLAFTESKGWELTYTKKVPPEAETSTLESFISALFLPNNFNWYSLNTKEIISSWLMGVDFDDI
jgi:hypothetical protein